MVAVLVTDVAGQDPALSAHLLPGHPHYGTIHDPTRIVEVDGWLMVTIV